MSRPSLAALFPLLLAALVVGASFEAFAARGIRIHHTETAYTGPDYFATVPYTRGYAATVERDLTIRGISLWGDFPSTATCVARVYDSGGTLRAEGEPTVGSGTGSAANADWWTLPIDTELWAGEDVTLAVYCSGSGVGSSYHPHRDAPTSQLDALEYFTDLQNRSFFGDGYPNGINTWWGDWRVEVEQHGLHAEQSTQTGVLNLSSSRGADLTPSRPLSITGIDFAADLGVAEDCRPQIFDLAGTMIAEGTQPVGDGSGIRWYRSDVAAFLSAGLQHTIALYCADGTPISYWWNGSSVYGLEGDATNVRGRSGGGDGIRPVTANAITPILQFREGEVEFVERDGATDSPGYSPWTEWSWGWRFTPDVDMTVLGVESLIVRPSGTAVARLYETATATLLSAGTESMPTSSELEWRAAPLPPILLRAGTEYTLVVHYSGGSIGSSPFYGGTSGSTSRPGVISDVRFCGGTAADVMPTSCVYNKRVERMRIDLPEPGFGIGAMIGIAALAGLASRRRRANRD